MLIFKRFLLFFVFLNSITLMNSYGAEPKPSLDPNDGHCHDCDGYYSSVTPQVYTFAQADNEINQSDIMALIQEIKNKDISTIVPIIYKNILDHLLHKKFNYNEQFLEEIFQIIKKVTKNPKIISSIDLILTCFYFKLAINKHIAKDKNYLSTLTPCILLKYLTGAFILALKVNADHMSFKNIYWFQIMYHESYYWQKMLPEDKYKLLIKSENISQIQFLIFSILKKIELEFLNIIDFDVYVNPFDKDFYSLVQICFERDLHKDEYELAATLHIKSPVFVAYYASQGIAHRSESAPIYKKEDQKPSKTCNDFTLLSTTESPVPQVTHVPDAKHKIKRATSASPAEKKSSANEEFDW